MKPIIGIVCRKGKSDCGHDTLITYTQIVLSVIKSGGIPVGIYNNNFNDYLNICDGFILQGGDDIDNNNFEIISYVSKKNIPILGICLGMQEMGVYAGGSFTFSNQLINKDHSISINKDSLLYRIIGFDNITVNSRHKDVLFKTDMFVSAKFNNTIEAVEDNTKRFFLGVQWHPESTYDSDINSRKIFDYFIKMCHH